MEIANGGWPVSRRTFGSDAHLVLGVVLQETLHTAARKLNQNDVESAGASKQA